MKPAWGAWFATGVTLMVAPLLVIVPAAGAETVAVTTTADTYGGSAGECSLREAITAAQTDVAFDGCAAGSGADVISLPGGEYKITRPGAGEDMNLTGDFDVTGTGALTIQPAGDQAKVVVDGNGLDRIYDQQGNSSLAIRNQTIKGGVLILIEDGGGVRNNVGALTLSGSTLTDNSSAYSAGGVAVYGGLNMDNSTVSGNSAAGDGGGLYFPGGSSGTVKSSTITGNVADSDASGNGDGGGFSLSTMNGVTFRNVIDAGNEDHSPLVADRAPDCQSGPFFFPRYSISVQPFGAGNCLTGFNPPTNKTVGDPGLGPLADNGGQTPAHALLAGSPAIGAGGSAAPDLCPVADQTGRVRPVDACDIGAVQYVEPTPPPPPGTVAVEIAKIRPKTLKLKRGKKAKAAKVKVGSTGTDPATATRLCLKAGKKVRKSIKVKGKLCRDLGTLTGVKTVKFKLAAKRKAKPKLFKIKVRLTATGAATKTGVIKVRVR